MHTRLVVHVAPISAVDKFLYKNIDAAAADAADDDDAAEPGWRHGVVHRYRCLTSSTAVVNNTQWSLNVRVPTGSNNFLFHRQTVISFRDLL